jgi:hypothetical protein
MPPNLACEHAKYHSVFKSIVYGFTNIIHPLIVLNRSAIFEDFTKKQWRMSTWPEWNVKATGGSFSALGRLWLHPNRRVQFR